MKFPEQAVTLEQQQMDVFERLAKGTGITGSELLKAVLMRVIDSLEQAHKSCDPVHGSFASSVPPVRAGGLPSNVFQLPTKG
jgi:hypothetical protein